jgi:hypothetical protein
MRIVFSFAAAVAMALPALASAPSKNSAQSINDVHNAEVLHSYLLFFQAAEHGAATETQVAGGGIGLGYVAGIADTLNDLQVICIPSGVMRSQEAHTVLKYLNVNLGQLQSGSAVMASRALKDAFPCQAE